MPVNTGSGYIAPARIFDRNDAPIDANNRFPVDAILSSPISVGSVTIKDGSSGNLAVVDATGALKVTTTAVAGIPINAFATSTVPATTEVTLVSYTVPSGKTFYLSEFIVGGMSDGRFTVRSNGIINSVARNSAANKTLVIKFVNSPTTNSGFIVDVLCYNESNQARIFEGTINGYIM